jgi:hypothetical protein
MSQSPLLAPLPSEATSDWHKLAAHWPALTMTTGPVQLSPDPETSALNFAGAPSRPPQGDAISIWSGSKARNVANRSSPSSRHQRNIDNEVRLYPPRAVGSSFRRCGPVWGRHRLGCVHCGRGAAGAASSRSSEAIIKTANATEGSQRPS